jgi:hypothetical protein
MKKGYIICLVALVAIVTALASSNIPTMLEGNNAPATRGLPPNFHLEADFPSLDSDQVTLYKIVPDDFSPSRFKDIGRKFGLTGEPEFVDNEITPDTYIIAGEDGKTLKYHEQTGMWIYVSDNAYPTVSQQPKLPSDSEAQEIAESFLKENGFWSDNMVFSHIVYDLQRIGKKSTGEIIKEFILTKKVCFKQIMNGIELGGVGSKCRVTIGEGGKIVAFMLPMRTFESVGTALLIPPDKAFENLQQGRGIRSLPRTNFTDREITITSISFCYYVDSLLEEPGNIVLCYKYEGKFCDNGEEFLAYANAVEI